MATIAYSLTAETRQHMWNVVIKDLALLDVQVQAPAQPKRRDRPPEQKGGGKVFGVSLADQPAETVESIGRVPLFLVSARAALRKCLHVEGLFRKTGSVARQRTLRALVDTGQAIPDDVFVHDLTGLVKQFIRELPEPLIPAHLAPAFFDVCGEPDEHNRVRLLMLVCLMLPPDHLEMLSFLADMLREVAEQEENNKMNSYNLAVCLSPNMFRGPANEAVCAKMVAKEVKIVSELISNSKSIGLLPDALDEQIKIIDSLPDNLTYCASSPTSNRKLSASGGGDAGVSLDDGSIADDKKKKRSGSVGKFFKKVRSSIDKLLKPTNGSSSSAALAAATPGSKRKVEDEEQSGHSPDDPSVPKKRKPLMEARQVHGSATPARSAAPETSTPACDPAELENSNAGSKKKKSKDPFKLLRKRRSLSASAATDRPWRRTPLTASWRGAAASQGLASASPSIVGSSPATGWDPLVGSRLANLDPGGADCSLAFTSAQWVASANRSSLRQSSVRASPISAAGDAPLQPTAAGGSSACALIGGSERLQTAADRPALPAPFLLRRPAIGSATKQQPPQHEHSVLLPRHWRADLVAGAGDLLPSRPRPPTPLGAAATGGRIDKAQISGPLPFYATALAAAPAETPTAGTLQQLQLGDGRCRLLSLDEAATSGAGRPRLSPPESPSLFVRVRSFREQQCPPLACFPTDDKGSSRAGSSPVPEAPAGRRHATFGFEAYGSCETGAEGSRPGYSGADRLCSGSSVRLLPPPSIASDNGNRPGNSCHLRASSQNAVEARRPLSAFEAAPAVVSATIACPVGLGGGGASCSSARSPSAEGDGNRPTGADHTPSLSDFDVVDTRLAPAGVCTAADDSRRAVGRSMHSPSTGDERAAGTVGSALSHVSSSFAPEATRTAEIVGWHAASAAAASQPLPPSSCSLGLPVNRGMVPPPPPPAKRQADGRVVGSRELLQPPLKVLGSSADGGPGRRAPRESISRLQEAGLVRRNLRSEAAGGRSEALDTAAAGSCSGRGSAAAQQRAPGDRKSAACRFVGDTVVRRRPQGLPASVFAGSDRGYCVEVVKAVVEGRHDDIVSRRSASISCKSRQAAGQLPAAAAATGPTTSIHRTDVQRASGCATVVEVAATPLIVGTRAMCESTTSQSSPAAAAASVARPRIKEPVLLWDSLGSAPRGALSNSRRQLKRLTSSPGALVSGRAPKRANRPAAAAATVTPPTRGCSPLPCSVPRPLSTLAYDGEHDTLV